VISAHFLIPTLTPPSRPPLNPFSLVALACASGDKGSVTCAPRCARVGLTSCTATRRRRVSGGGLLPICSHGLPGCIAVDVIRIAWDRRPVELSSLYKGKVKFASVAVQCTADHSMRFRIILTVQPGIRTGKPASLPCHCTVARVYLGGVVCTIDRWMQQILICYHVRPAAKTIV